MFPRADSCGRHIQLSELDPWCAARCQDATLKLWRTNLGYGGMEAGGLGNARAYAFQGCPGRALLAHAT